MPPLQHAEVLCIPLQWTRLKVFIPTVLNKDTSYKGPRLRGLWQTPELSQKGVDGLINNDYQHRYTG